MLKTLRRVGSFFGKVLDADDRKFLAQGFVLIGAIATLLLTFAGSLGLALRLFEIARG